MTDKTKRPDPNANKDSVKDLQQNSSIEDKNRKDRPGTKPGQPPTTNDDYDYRPDFGTSGGAVEYDKDKVTDGTSDDQKRAKLPKQEGDNPKDLNKPEEKMGNQTSKK